MAADLEGLLEGLEDGQQALGQRTLELVGGLELVALPAQAQLLEQMAGGLDATVGHQ